MNQLIYRLSLGALLGSLLATAPALAQGVGIGTTTPNAAAALDITATATGKGLLIPRLDSATRVAIASPPTGLLVFQTSPRVGFYYYAGGSWLFLPDRARSGDNLGNHTATQNLNLQTNALVGTGADIGSTVGVGVRADGGLNLGQNSNNSVYLGYQAGASNSGNSNLFVGYQSGSNSTRGIANVFSGAQSGYSNTTGNFNVFNGASSGFSNTTGGNNTFSGTNSGFSNTTGDANTFSGSNSGFNNTTGRNNVFSGNVSGISNETGSNNVFIGTANGFSNTTGSNNAFSGSISGFNNTTGDNNTFSGYQSGQANTTGSGNVFSGSNSGSSNTTGANNTAIGFNAGPLNGTGDLANTTTIGYNAKVSASNSVVLGNGANVGIGTSAPKFPLEVASTGGSQAGNFAYYAATSGGGVATGAGTTTNTNVSIRAAGRVAAAEFNAYSDARLKTIRGLSDGRADLALLGQLRITDYQMRDRAQYGAQAFKKVIAQEVEQVYPQAIQRSRGFVPTIYAAATLRPGAAGRTLLAVPAAHGLRVGERVRLIGAANGTLETTVLALDGPLGFAVALPKAETHLFVYGPEVADLRTVDYEALSMLNVSATQELARQVAALQAANARLQAQAAASASAQADLQSLRADLLSLRQLVQQLQNGIPTAQASQ